MKKNFFFALLEEEFVWLKRAVSPEFPDSPVDCEEICRSRHEILVSRLFRDFMTPLERRNLYGISLGILGMFSLFRGCGPFSAGETDLFLRTVDLFLPLSFDERVLALEREFCRQWNSPSLSRRMQFCREGFSELVRLVTVAALDHV
ncbi:MAG: hypothetical protein J6M34_00480 [Clostridia bacterium]|nr:hypothetical protein [Clostridia bacterium]